MGFSSGRTSTAHIYFTVPFPRDVVLVTFGDRDKNLARVEAMYGAIGWKLVGKEMVQTGQIVDDHLSVPKTIPIEYNHNHRCSLFAAGARVVGVFKFLVASSFLSPFSPPLSPRTLSAPPPTSAMNA